MKREEITPKYVRELVDLINSIGDAGEFGISNFTIKDSIGKDRITFNTVEGDGSHYQFYDHILTVKFEDDLILTIETKAVENPEDCDYAFATQITITYHINDKKYRIRSYLNGWNYDNLLKFTDRKYLQTTKHLTNEDDDIKGPCTIKDSHKIDLGYGYNEQNVSDIVEFNIDNLIDKKNEQNEKINAIINSLSDDEIKVLKKKLAIVK